MSLRLYQIAGLDQIREHFSNGIRKALLYMPTGAGKTLCFCTIILEASKKGSYAMVVVKGKDLVQQASDRLDREKVPHGVIQGNHWRKLPDERTQVCSISTLARRKVLPRADIIVIDEAQDAGSDSYHWLASAYPNAFFVGVSATPHVRKGLRHIADVVVKPITVKELTEQGFLVPARYFIPTKIDTTNVSVVNGEFDQTELSDALEKSQIYGDIVESYTKLGENRPAIAFAVNIKHSLKMVETLNRAGIPSEHMEANTPQSERKAILERLQRGELKVVSNVGILTVGVDLPFVSCLIIARPTLSYNLHIQIIGRGTRPFEGKKDFIVLDHAANVLHLGPHTEERECNLDGYKKNQAAEKLMRRCEKCFFAWIPEKNKEPCPACSHLKEAEPREEKEREHHEASMVEFDQTAHQRKRESEIKKIINIQRAHGKKPGWVFYQLKDKYGDEYANRVWPAIKAML